VIPARIKIIDYEKAIEKNTYKSVRALIDKLLSLGYNVNYWARKENGFEVYIVEDTDLEFPKKIGYALVGESVVKQQMIFISPNVWELIEGSEKDSLTFQKVLEERFEEEDSSSDGS